MSDDVEILGKTVAYQGHFRIDLYRFRHRLHDGGWSGEVEREVFERGHAVGLLLYDPRRDAVALIEQFRVGALAAGMKPWQTEVVAGIIENGENAAEVARREAREEAGCEVEELLPIYRYLVSPGGTSETCQLYCALVDCSSIGGIHGRSDEQEDIRVEVMETDRALALLEQGAIQNAVTVIALQWLALNRRRLLRRPAAADAA